MKCMYEPEFEPEQTSYGVCVFMWVRKSVKISNSVRGISF